jgi:hypothetical protein
MPFDHSAPVTELKHVLPRHTAALLERRVLAAYVSRTDRRPWRS